MCPVQYRSLFRTQALRTLSVCFSAMLAHCTGTVSSPSGAGGLGAAENAPNSTNAGAALACDAPRVGATPLARLTRAQYARSVQALLGMDDVDVSGLAEDEKVGAFDGNVIAPLSELVIEQYVSLAEAVAKAAASDLPALFTCDRAAEGDAACAHDFIARFGLRAYRRPLSDDEQSAYAALYDAYAARGYTEALRVIVQTMLQSPHFLYHVELSPASPDASATIAPLDAFEVASRLSFFLVGATPDDALLAAAADGSLLEDATLKAAAERLLDDARANHTLEGFHLQWLGLDALAELNKDPAAFPGFDARYAPAMEDETRRFIRHVLREDDGSLDTLLTAPYSFPSGPLLAVYGLDAAGDGTTPVQLDPTQRAGLLTQPAFLAVHAHANQTSPVLRGKVVIRNLLCESLPDPPPNVVAKAPEPSPDATTRERFAEHEKDPACAGCHVRIDGIGFGFEAFDALGAHRDREAGKPVDARGSIVGSRDLDGSFDGAVALAHKLSQSAELSRCASTQWFRYALGRMETEADACALDSLARSFAASGRDVRALLSSIVLSPAFRTKRLPESSP